MLTSLFFIQLALMGALAGFMAGLLGVGGGLIIVPTLAILLEYHKINQLYVQHLAVGTSLFVMVFTSASSIWAHQRKGAIDWRIVRIMTIPLMLGALFGSLLAKWVPGYVLKWFFVVYAYSVAFQMLLNPRLTPHCRLPRASSLWGVSGLIGVISSLVGIGGGTLNVPFLSWCAIPLPRAIATSAALGWPVAFIGGLGYLAASWYESDLPVGSVGFVYLPAALILIVAAVTMAPQGARLAHSVPVSLLRKAFAVLMGFIATTMAVDLLN